MQHSRVFKPYYPLCPSGMWLKNSELHIVGYLFGHPTGTSIGGRQRDWAGAQDEEIRCISGIDNPWRRFRDKRVGCRHGFDGDEGASLCGGSGCCRAANL
jgi:hypothetical protein